MAIARNTNNDRLPNNGQTSNPTDTAKQNYTAIRYGNDQGSISFGHIHKPGDVTAAVLLQSSDSLHEFSLDKDGQRKGWTTSLSPGNFQVTCGANNEESQTSMMLHALNGDINIVASNGKIRMQANDIEIIAAGEGNDKGNIRLKATENIEANSKKLLMNAKNHYKIVSPGTGEVVCNGVLKMYGSIIQGVTDAVSKKDSKVGGQRFQKQNNQIGD